MLRMVWYQYCDLEKVPGWLRSVARPEPTDHRQAAAVAVVEGLPGQTKHKLNTQRHEKTIFAYLHYSGQSFHRMQAINQPPANEHEDLDETFKDQRDSVQSATS